MYKIVLSGVGKGADSPNYKEIIADSADDLSDVVANEQCAPGSLFYTADIGSLYILAPDGTWTSAI